MGGQVMADFYGGKPITAEDYVSGMSRNKAYARNSAQGRRGDLTDQAIEDEILSRSGLSRDQLTPAMQAQLQQLTGLSNRGSKKFGTSLKGFQETAPVAIAQQQEYAPYKEAGMGVLEQQQALLGLKGADAMNNAYNLNPAQQFAQQQAEKALIRNRNVTGGRGDEGVQEALTRLTSGLTNQNIQGQLGQLGALSSQGYNASQNLANIAGGQIADAYAIGNRGQAQRAAANKAKSARNLGMVSNAINLGAGAFTGGASMFGGGANVVPGNQAYTNEVIGMNRDQFNQKYGY